ncbi:hypothetical protein EDD18DRAFT_1327314 [Armillaria luteobubalina]|uniref:Uncharacterized protein n=1 Tax=Armillaria luteobubalina TaxID=153913 RepID=A0AA39UTQ6_9AGAR|nr:hypothetical protein EDD18DRAFT_1327314 [Armillaria luteobubalina]
MTSSVVSVSGSSLLSHPCWTLTSAVGVNTVFMPMLTMFRLSSTTVPRINVRRMPRRRV